MGNQSLAIPTIAQVRDYAFYEDANNLQIVYEAWPKQMERMLDTTSTSKWMTLLEKAFSAKQMGVVELILSKECKIYKSTLPFILQAADIQSSSVLLCYLINRGANINTVDKYGYPPIAYAARCGNLISVKILINHKAKLNIDLDYGIKINPLAVAMHSNNLIITRYLIQNGCDTSFIRRKYLLNISLAPYMHRYFYSDYFLYDLKSEYAHKSAIRTKSLFKGIELINRELFISMPKTDNIFCEIKTKN